MLMRPYNSYKSVQKPKRWWLSLSLSRKSPVPSLESEVLFYSRSHNNNKLSRVSFSFSDSLPVDAHTTRSFRFYADSLATSITFIELPKRAKDPKRWAQATTAKMKYLWGVLHSFFSFDLYNRWSSLLSHTITGGGPPQQAVYLSLSISCLLGWHDSPLTMANEELGNSIFGYQ